MEEDAEQSVEDEYAGDGDVKEDCAEGRGGKWLAAQVTGEFVFEVCRAVGEEGLHGGIEVWVYFPCSQFVEERSRLQRQKQVQEQPQILRLTTPKLTALIWCERKRQKQKQKLKQEQKQVQKQLQKQPQILRLTTPELKNVRGPFRSG